MGVGVATSNTIGNALGARNPRLAATFCKAANVVALCVALACSVSILAVRTRLGAWYTDDGMVRGIVAGLLPYGAVYQIADALTVVGGGVLRGCGHQKIGAVVK